MRVDRCANDESTSVEIVRRARVDIVGETTDLPDLEEEAAAHPFTEDGVHHVEDVAIGMKRGVGGEAQQDLGLLRLLSTQADPRLLLPIARGLPRSEGRPLP